MSMWYLTKINTKNWVRQMFMHQIIMNIFKNKTVLEYINHGYKIWYREN